MKLLLPLLLSSVAAWAQAVPLANLDAKGLQPTVVNYQGRQATRLIGPAQNNGLAFLKGSSFRNGTIEVDLAGSPGAGTFEGARGFVGVAFRVQDGGRRYEAIYLRPTNGRADDMSRRNHSTQYVSEPDWSWNRLRQESPGIYESYVDLEPGAWTHYKIVVRGTRAELYVHGAAQPCLIVKDLKLGDVSGAIALWVLTGLVILVASLFALPRDRAGR